MWKNGRVLITSRFHLIKNTNFLCEGKSLEKFFHVTLTANASSNSVFKKVKKVIGQMICARVLESNYFYTNTNNYASLSKLTKYPDEEYH